MSKIIGSKLIRIETRKWIKRYGKLGYLNYGIKFGQGYPMKGFNFVIIVWIGCHVL